MKVQRIVLHLHTCVCGAQTDEREVKPRRASAPPAVLEENCRSNHTTSLSYKYNRLLRISKSGKQFKIFKVTFNVFVRSLVLYLYSQRLFKALHLQTDRLMPLMRNTRRPFDEPTEDKQKRQRGGKLEHGHKILVSFTA